MDYEYSKYGWKEFTAGCVAGGVSVTLAAPIEFIKTQIQLDARYANCGMRQKYVNFYDCFQKTVTKLGFFEMFQNVHVDLIATIPKVGIRFWSYEQLKSHFADANGRVTQVESILCGTSSGIIEAIIIVTPMESLGIKLINDTATRQRFQGMTFFQGASYIIRQQGLRSLYQGLVPTTLKQGSNQGIRFWAMETLKDKYRKGDPSVPIPTLVIGIFGGMAGIASVCCNTPFDVVKTRYKEINIGLPKNAKKALNGRKKYKGVLDCAKKIWHREGPTAFYKGFGPRTARVSLDVAVSFVVYDALIDLLNTLWF